MPAPDRALLEASISFPIGLVFVVSAVPKIRQQQRFILTVTQYHIVPVRAVSIVARLVPTLELFLATLLLTGTAVGIAARGACFLFATFIIAISLNLIRGREFDCGCAGPGHQKISWRLVLQDTCLLVTSIVLASLSSSLLQSEWWPFLHVSEPRQS